MAEAITDRGPADDETEGYGEDDSTEAFLARVVKQFNRAEAAEAENRSLALDDLRFKAGDQWPEDVKEQRMTERRPCLTINKMKTFTHQITNDQRQNRPAINVSPVGDKGDPETAKMLKGLIKQIERQSNADIAYDTGFDNAVSNGWGYWRIRTDYEDDKSFDQVIIVDRIRNPFRVYLDPDSQEPDGSDAKWCFITDLIPRAEFEEEWPDADPLMWTEGGLGDDYESWTTQTHIRIAEYYCFETEERNLLALSNGHVGYEDQLAPELMAQIEADPEMIVKERVVQVESVKWYKLTAKEILEESEWLGKWLPVIKCIGDEADIEGKVTYAGLVRDAKDAQRMYNFWSTSETELIALAPKAPWIMEEGQIEGHEDSWASANTKSLPYLLYRGTSIAGRPSLPPQRQQFAGPPTGVVQAKIAASQDMQATTGIRFDATLQERTYDESGKALRELKRVGDLGNFHYVDNLSRSLRHTGRILVDLIPKIYDTPRVLTILREDGSEEQVAIDPSQGRSASQKQLPDGRVQRLYNPKLGQYDVAVTVGPNFATKRAEAADSMLSFMKAVPQSGPLIGDLIAKNMDWPGAEEIAVRLAAMLPPQLLDKKLDQIPPEAKALVGSLMQQLQQLKQEHDKAVAMVADKDKDRQIEYAKIEVEREKIGADFASDMAKIQGDLKETIIKLMAEGEQNNEAAMAKVAADFQAKIFDVVSKAEIARLELGADIQNQEKERQLKATEIENKKAAEAEDSKKATSEMQQVLNKLMTTVDEMKSKPKRKKGNIVAPSGKVYKVDITED